MAPTGHRRVSTTESDSAQRVLVLRGDPIDPLTHSETCSETKRLLTSVLKTCPPLERAAVPSSGVACASGGQGYAIPRARPAHHRLWVTLSFGALLSSCRAENGMRVTTEELLASSQWTE